MQKLQKRILVSKGLDYNKTWHLLDVATDPAEEGKGRPSIPNITVNVHNGYLTGYCGKVLRYGLSELAKNNPVILESTTPRSRNLYAHLGFEV